MSRRDKKGYTRKQRQILALFCGFCALCGKEIKNHSEFSQDHDMPKSRGGSNSIKNLLPMHRKCNEEKGNRTLEEYVIDNDYQKKLNRMATMQKQRG